MTTDRHADPRAAVQLEVKPPQPGPPAPRPARTVSAGAWRRPMRPGSTARRSHRSALARQRSLVAIEERTRQQIAEFLHDRVQADLLIASQRLWRCLGLLRAQPESVEALLTLTIEDLDRVRERDVRQVSHILHPSAIKISLVAALYLLTEPYQASFEVAIAPSADVVALDDSLHNRLSEGVRLTAYRIVEQALANAARHARATRVQVALSIEQLGARRHLRVDVRDDGVGFDPASFNPRLGLACIASRVGQAGGRWRITPRADDTPGTALTAWLPIGQ